MEKIDLKKVLQYPLTPVPLSLAHTDGSLNKTDKSKLFHKLEDQLLVHDFPQWVDVVVVDATFLKHLQHNLSITFGPLLKICFSNCATWVIKSTLSVIHIHLIQSKI